VARAGQGAHTAELRSNYAAVIIGSGFGGAVLACRTARTWPGDVLVLERGKRYPMGSFPRSPRGMAENFWNLASEERARPSHRSVQRDLHGLFDIRNYRHLDAVLCAGLGGGSLIYANVFLEPPDQLFDEGWPRGWSRAKLAPYYAVAKSVLGARPIPQDGDSRREIIRTRLFNRVADSQGRPHRLVDINVFFGNDFETPLAIGVQDRNRYGALQTSCTYCGECDVGCNTHSKNTLDLNYLFVAEQRYAARILTEHLATKIAPVNTDGADDPTTLGENGYRVYFTDLLTGRNEAVLARGVIVSSGAFGSTELLLRCRDVFGTLPHVSPQLGRRFSANGDFLSFAIAGEHDAGPNYGPVITRLTDYNLFSDFDRSRAFLLEDAAYPAFASWYVEGVLPAVSMLRTISTALAHLFRRWLGGASLGRIGFFLSDLFKDDPSFRSCVMLCMGLDKASGTMRLDRNGLIDVDWPYRDNLPLYEAILAAAEAFGREIGAKVVVPLPNWCWPTRSNITVHALGGCGLADDPQSGVVDAAAETMGQVFGYSGLYVADGAIVPTALGANPTATIAALAEMVAEGITGRPSDDAL
jgi:cholesterol oxidase